MNQLRPQGRTDTEEIQILVAVMDRHLSALAQVILVAIALVQHLVDGESSCQTDTGLAVLPEHEIL